MPIFEYRCRLCGHCVELLQKSASRDARKCPQCDQLALARALSAPTFQLRGSGWRKPAARPRSSQPPRTIGHTLDSGAPHSHDSHSHRDGGHVKPQTQGHSHGHTHSHTHGKGHKH